MRANENLGRDCKACTGTCCTFVNNTMQVSILEALDIFMDMVHKNRLTSSWRSHLEDCVQSFGLDRGNFGAGSRAMLRRSYTCPFFNRENWGCGVAVHRKPYGCLAFNPVEASIHDGGSCRSSREDLEEQNKAWHVREATWNGELQRVLNVNGDKMDIPRAVLQIWNVLGL